MAREEKIVIRVSEKMKNDFQELADSMGMSMSGLGAFVIGHYMREELHRRQMQDKLLEQLSPHLLESLASVDVADPRFEKVVTDTITKLSRQAQ